jgi:hypothetical protein
MKGTTWKDFVDENPNLLLLDVSVDSNLQGFQFFINGEIQEDIPYHPSEDVKHHITFPSLDPGRYIFHWIYHQPVGSNRRKVITVTDIEVVGSHNGGAENYESCQAGLKRERLFFVKFLNIDTPLLTRDIFS